MVVRKRGSKWEYDFRLLGKRHRDGGYAKKALALMAEAKAQENLLAGKRWTYADAWNEFLAGTEHAVLTRERYLWLYEHFFGRFLGPLYTTEIHSTTFDKLRVELLKERKANSVNTILTMAKAPLTYCWRRNLLPHPPWMQRAKEADKPERWYTVEQRDRFLAGVFEHAPQWYLFFYMTARLGLRRGELYALTHDKFRRDTMEILIDCRAVPGKQDRESFIAPGRKSGDTLLLRVSQDVFDAYDWHCNMGHAGDRLVMFASDRLTMALDGHKTVLRSIQVRLGLPLYPHHAIGRHSVASQADATQQTPTTIQAQLGHKNVKTTMGYIHASKRKAQSRVQDALRPARAPHEPPAPNPPGADLTLN